MSETRSSRPGVIRAVEAGGRSSRADGSVVDVGGLPLFTETHFHLLTERQLRRSPFEIAFPEVRRLPLEPGGDLAQVHSPNLPTS